MHKLTIIGTARPAFERVIKEAAGVLDCEFMQLDAALEEEPGAFTLIDIDLERGSRLTELKDWLADKPAGAKVVFVTDKSSHLQGMRASAIGGTDVIHRPYSGRTVLAKFIDGVAAMPAQAAPPLAPSAPEPPVFERAADGLKTVFTAAAAGGPIDATTMQSAATAVVDEIDKLGLTSWVDTVRMHHSQTYQHCLLVTGVAVAFADHLKLSRVDRERLSFAGMLHDIGKARVPLAILEKPGALDFNEMVEMRNHPVYGFEMLSDPQVVSAEMLDMVVHHHEYLDGSGYPHGLKGSEISDLVRVITIADIFGALLEKRSYKPPFTGAAAYKILLDMGPKLDRDLVRAFEFVSRFDQREFAPAK
jgi:putative nucleotidyltransferase with HDIG domain